MSHSSPYAVAPGLDTLASPERMEAIVEGLRKVSSLHGLEQHEYVWLASHGTELFFPSGATLFQEDRVADKMIVLLDGEVHVRREHGGSALFVGRSGQISGLMPFSRMKKYGGLGFAVGDVWALTLHCSQFDAMLAAIPSMAQRCVGLLLDRVREVTRIEQQSEKLNALGKLAGNLAHELNNPASAAQRAASGLLEELRVYGQRKYELGSICLRPEELAAVRAWQESMRDRLRLDALDPALFAAREDAIQAWLNGKGLNETW